MTHEIIRSLETIQDQVKQELLSVRKYRAYLAIGQAIEEISEVEEIARSLNGIRSQVVDHLHDVREYRALLAVQKSVLDISEVLGLLEESSRKPAEAASGNGAAPAPADQPLDDSQTSASVTAAATPSEPVAVAPPPAPSSVTMVDQTSEPEQPPESATKAVEATSAHAAHEGDAASPSAMDAIGHSPFLSSKVMTDHGHEYEQPREPTGETVEIAAPHVAHEGEAASRSEMEAIEHPPSPAAAAMAAHAHEQEQPRQPPEQTAEHAASGEAHEGAAAEGEDIGIAKVA
jgi:hypothetical protein